MRTKTPLLQQIILLSSIFLIVMGCQKELKDPGANPPTGGGVNDNITVAGGIRGVVVDENNQPVSGATIKSGTATTTTDRYGVFQFRNINLSKENGHVQVEKTGYFTGHRTFVSTANRIHNLRIKLLPKSNTGSFSASAGGTVTLASGGKMVMPANAVTDASGNAYSGQVNVAMTWIDPSAPNLPEIMMGDLRGVTTGGQERGLETYGMLGVEMTSPSGQQLKVASGKTAELTFPVPASLNGVAPATIDLWHFDEATGRWKQEGAATKSGSNYVANVSHFSFWNCDAPFPLINLCMTLVNAANNQPLINVQVRVKRANGSYGWGWTDSLGSLCGKVPKNEPLTLEVLDQCNTVAFSQSIGPFSADASLGTVPVTLPGPNTLVITGTLQNCSNNNVTNGVVIVYTGNSFSYSVPVVNGAFSFTMIRCSGGPINFAVRGIDLATLLESPMYNGSGTSGTVNIGTLQACGSLTEYVEYIIDGVPYTWVDLGQPNTINAYDSTATNGYTTKTGVFAQHVTNGSVEHTYFYFYNNTAPGTYPLDNVPFQVRVNIPPAGGFYLTKFVSANPMVNISTFGPVATGYIEGSFTEQMTYAQGAGPVYNVICNFKVKR